MRTFRLLLIAMVVLVALASVVLIASAAHAAVAPEEARQLGTTLTEVGAIRAGNAAGTIPAFTGGIATPPPGYSPRAGAYGGAPYLDPFAGEKPLYTITAKNMAAYAAQLDEGNKVLLQRFPETYRMDVYPTHRSATLPRFALENTVKYAGRPHLSADGIGIIDAHAQVPFPIPKNGYEAMWNYQLRYFPPWETCTSPIWLVDTSGAITKLSDDPVIWEHAYWDPARTATESYLRLTVETGWPAARAGEKTLSLYPLRLDRGDSLAWIYIPGQRRVRLAPEVRYDTVLSSFGGLLFADESGGGLTGRMDKFDMKLIGRREMIVPYNAYRFAQAPPAEGALKQHHNPDVLRFELHRVWVVEGTLKAGERHADSKKVWLLDEDSWAVTTYWSYDQAGKIFRLMLNGLFMAYDLPAVRTDPLIVYDLIKGGYLYASTFAPPSKGFVRIDPPAQPDVFFSPDALAGAGIR